MGAFFTQLEAINTAQDAVAREQAVDAAKKSVKKIPDLIDAVEDADALEEYSEQFGAWVDGIPHLMQSPKKKAKKKSKKLLLSLINIAALRNRVKTETKDEFIEEINRCKNIKELAMLSKGKSSYHFPVKDEAGVKKTIRIVMPTLEDRAARIKMTDDEFLTIYSKRNAYLKKKKLADRFALGLNAVLSILGVGLICGIAIMAILPLMPLAAFIPVLIVFSLLGGYVEGFVYHGYVQKFCRNVVRGFLETIENNILNREYGKKKWLLMSQKERDSYLKKMHASEANEAMYRDLGRKVRLTLTKEERKQALKKHHTEIMIKKILVIAAIPVGIASGVGFAGLAFTQLLGLLPILGVATGIVTVAAPWALAIIVGPLYAMVMYSMIHRAIKNNVFMQMKENAIALFKRKEGQSMAAHVALCALKLLGLGAILAISVAATVFTAGAWLESSVSFFAAAVGLIDLIANKIGWVIGAVFLGTGLWFSLEKGLDTAKSMWDSFAHALEKGFSSPKVFSSPKNFFKACLNFIPFIIHLVGTGAVAALGTDAVGELPKKIGDTWSKILVTSIGTTEEGLVDWKDYGGGHKHEKGGHCDHSHGDVASDVVSVFKGVGTFFARCFGKKKKKVEEQIDISPSLRGGL